ncbi:HAD-IA family hydrolase [Micromonospora sp. 4G57]|uniref:HAD-IA family hydrolase n=1 Tax=Micromonospora sicca TaxID=2202420 RepID=A0ABU5JEW9_9ACTN|nr:MULTISPECIES: HAD-IA family hydrolase [unclassified Micromonospora]MDZ5445457.1 HAD-IA family hydrolase [Micromonospora sp. 4G57]MDZ5491133.1 HAD-IA family hydrolase [Micromonospora sp. 4G53]
MGLLDMDGAGAVVGDLSAVDAVLLDMDGTLVDSDAAVERAWRVWADEYDVDLESALAIAHGSPADRTVRRLLPHLDDAAVAASAARQLELQYDDLSDVTATRGALELLATLARFRLPWAVVTSADTRLAKARLAAAGIDAPVLVTVDDVSVGKPDPQGYLRAALLLDVPPELCLVVEDAAVGVQAGRAAGALTAALKGVDADLRVADLAQLAHLLTRSRR